MIEEFEIGQEMSEEEKQTWHDVQDLISRVESEEREDVAQPTNMEAIVEGLL